ncbi:MAG: thioredoxin domain-containing protein [Atribacterota bacterium]
MTERKPNRLIAEKSPYLKQHAFQPVDWYPWSEEAFSRAKELDRPVFLSIGYSTCHWCHVMAEETFENEEIARLMNDTFISIKVDREERPDIDHIYMTAAQFFTDSLGWPLSVVMTPEGTPFFAATYLPPYSRFGLLGMKELIMWVQKVWKNERQRIETSTQEVSTLVSSSPLEGHGNRVFEEALLRKAFDALWIASDREWGGLKGQPKFPLPHNILFLLRVFREWQDQKALTIAERTLEALRDGGIFDQVGFGFHRYATDSRWLVPHFEKMLYDQALLAIAYIEAFALTRKPEYQDVVREIFTYVFDSLTAPQGSFYAAEDADSPEGEGAFYLFTLKEVRDILGETLSPIFEQVFSLREEGNFPHSRGKNILHRRHSLSFWAEKFGYPEGVFRQMIEEGRKKLFDYRAQRPRPSRDEKILTDWNGLMIGALARAALYFHDDTLLLRAKNAADFFLDVMVDSSGHLFHLFTGEPAIPGYLDDYAFLTFGLLELYRATLEERYLQGALRLTERTLDLFFDPQGGFFFTPSGVSTPLFRPRVLHDGAIPSGNSVAIENCLRLSRLLFRADLENRVSQMLDRISPLFERNPLGYTYLAQTVFSLLRPGLQMVLVAPRHHPQLPSILEILKHELSFFLFLPEDDCSSPPWNFLPEGLDFRSIAGEPTFYLCQHFTCQEPTTDLKLLMSRIRRQSFHS